MFKNLFGFWSSRSLLKQLLDEFAEIMKISEEMYERTLLELTNPTKDPQLKQGIYDMDQRINHLEKNIRRRIVEHLAINPGEESPFCLILMSVVKDAERLGDYIKNLLEMTTLPEQPVEAGLFEEYFCTIPHDLTAYFARSAEAFVNSDEDLARELISQERAIGRQCDNLILKLAESDLPANRAVGFALTARFLKRIASHLTNIVTSVVMPIAELDYYDEKPEPTA